MGFSLPTPRVLKEIVSNLTEKATNAVKNLETILGYKILTPSDITTFQIQVEKRIRTIYLFAMGISNNSPEEIRQLCREITSLVWMKGAVPNDRVQWYVWSSEDPLGFIIRSAEVRIKLMEKKYITATELAIISNTSSGNISHHIRNKTIKAIKSHEDNREWLIPPEEALNYLKNTRADFLASVKGSYLNQEQEIDLETRAFKEENLEIKN